MLLEVLATGKKETVDYYLKKYAELNSSFKHYIHILT